MSNPNPTPPPPGKGRGKGNRNKRSHIRDALQKLYEERAVAAGETGPVDGVQSFWMAEAQLALDGDAQARSTLAKRLEPELRSMQLDANLEHSSRELSDTERVEKLASILASGGEAGAGLAALLRHMAGDDRPPDGGGEE